MVEFYPTKTRNAIIFILLAFIYPFWGCGVSWQGKVIYLKEGKVLISPENEEEIKPGRKVLLYRIEEVRHPMTGDMLGEVEDEIVKTPVIRIGDKTVTAFIEGPEFDILKVGDMAEAVRGLEKVPKGGVYEAGQVIDVNIESGKLLCQFNQILDTELETPAIFSVIKYDNRVTKPVTGETIALVVKPVADLDIPEINPDENIKASYRLINPDLGWIEVGDVIVHRYGYLVNENLWFQEPPSDFSYETLFARNYLRGLRLYNSSDYREALLEFQYVAELMPTYRKNLLLMGLCYTELNRLDEAEKHLLAFLEINPESPEAWTALAYCYIQKGDAENAAKTYEYLAELLGDNPGAWIDAGGMYKNAGKSEEARKAYNKALEIDSNNEKAIYELKNL
ncbi:tetratricopeptide repeat protein [Candidatus Poribacteria bacterium]|nr:tetratricopeptide repeat protein [Candidatus Poribacteria bacterium]